MMSNHKFFVGRDDPNFDAACSSDYPLSALRVGRFIDFNSQPYGLTADTAADKRRVFSDAGSKHNCIQPAKCSRQRAELTADSVKKKVDGKPGRSSSLANSERISLEMPDTPRSPYWV